MHAAFAAGGWGANAFAGLATPSPAPEVDPNLVTPGPWGFVVIAVLAVAVVALIGDMMRRIRRGRVRADVSEQLDAEKLAAAQAAEAVDASDADDQDIERSPDRPHT